MGVRKLKWLFWGIVTFLFIIVKYLGGFEPIELAIYDHFWKLAPLESSDNRIVIVAIEEEDIRDLGQWPMSDDQLAKILDIILAQNPRVIGLDIFRDLEVTGRLKEIFQTSEELVGVGVHSDIDFPPILRAKEQVGDVSVVDEPQWGYLRRVYLYRLADGSEDSRIGHLSLKLAITWLKEDKDSFSLKPHPKTGELVLNDQLIGELPSNAGGYSQATDAKYQMLVRWRKGAYSKAIGDTSFKVVTLSELNRGQIAPDLFTDKIVLIGARASSIKDRFITPIGWQYGVDTIAHETSQIISAVVDNRPFFRFIPDPLEYALILLMIMWVYLHNYYLGFERIWWQLGVHCGIAATVLASIYGLGFWAFTQAWWIPVGQLLLTYGISLIIMLSGNYISYLNFVTQNQEKIITEKTVELQSSLEELKKAQENNIQNAKQVTLAKLSNSLTHNLKMYFGVLRGCSERLAIVFQRNRFDLIPSEIELMQETFQELEHIFENLRGIFREGDFLNPSFFNLQELILERVNASEVESEKVELSLDTAPVNLFIPRSLLSETLRNLLNNALESMEGQERKQLHLKTFQDSENQVRIVISDTGSGIPPEILSEIYEPLFTTKDEGWGFGLYFVYQAVSYLKGKINVKSEEGKGTSVTLTIPIDFSEALKDKN